MAASVTTVDHAPVFSRLERTTLVLLALATAVGATGLAAGGFASLWLAGSVVAVTVGGYVIRSIGRWRPLAPELES